MNDSRFVIATHILTVLADREEMAFNSCQVAGSVNTNPVVIRRVMGLLAKAGLVQSTPGATGGSQLARSAEKITLRDIYEATGGGEIFAMHHQPPNQGCYVGANIQAVLRPVLDAAAGCVADELAKTTLADIRDAVQAKRSGVCGQAARATATAAKTRGGRGRKS